VSKALGCPWDWLMSCPRSPIPGTDKVGKCPTVAQRGGEGEPGIH